MHFTSDALPPGHALFPAPTYFDETQFFGRTADVERIRQLLDAGSSVAVSGKRRIGRSWFLQHLHSTLPADQYVVVYSHELKPDTIVPRQARLFLYALIYALCDALRIHLGVNQPCTLLDLANPPPNIGQAFRRDLTALHQHLAAARRAAVILIDEAEALLEFADEPETIPAIVRSMATGYPHLRVIVAGFDLRSPLGNQPALFHNFAHHHLYGIGPKGAYHLIADQLVKYGVLFTSADVWEQVLAWTGTEPMLLRLLGQQLTEQARAHNGMIGTAQVQAAIDDFYAMSEVGAMLNFAWRILGDNLPIHALITALAYSDIPDIAAHTTLMSRITSLFYAGHPPEAVQHDLRRLCTLGFLYADEQTDCYHFSSGLLREWIRRHRPNPGV